MLPFFFTDIHSELTSDVGHRTLVRNIFEFFVRNFHLRDPFIDCNHRAGAIKSGQQFKPRPSYLTSTDVGVADKKHFHRFPNLVSHGSMNRLY